MIRLSDIMGTLTSAYLITGNETYAAQAVIENWRKHYNTRRTHSSLGYPPPAPEVVILGEMRGVMENGRCIVVPGPKKRVSL